MIKSFQEFATTVIGFGISGFIFFGLGLYIFFKIIKFLKFWGEFDKDLFIKRFSKKNPELKNLEIEEKNIEKGVNLENIEKLNPILKKIERAKLNTSIEGPFKRISVLEEELDISVKVLEEGPRNVQKNVDAQILLLKNETQRKLDAQKEEEISNFREVIVLKQELQVVKQETSQVQERIKNLEIEFNKKKGKDGGSS